LSGAAKSKADIVGTGAAALTAVNGDPPDLILLDLSLPLLDGLELFRILRHRPATATIPIIMLTARASEADRVTGIELGAEDYITKPFSPRELVARAKSAMRRAKGQAPPTGPAPYKGKHLFVDFDAISIRVDNAAVTLTRREFELLKFPDREPQPRDSRATGCSSACGASTSRSKRGRWTCTSPVCAASSALPASRSRPSLGWDIGSAIWQRPDHRRIDLTGGGLPFTPVRFQFEVRAGDERKLQVDRVVHDGSDQQETCRRSDR
jgi:CheY-like chemotaxis protein